MYRFIFLLFLFQFKSVYSQRVFSSTGILVSFLDMKTTDINDIESSVYPKELYKSSISLSFETKEWKRLTLSTTATYFESGGKRKNTPMYNQNKLFFDNVCLGLTGNYYILNSKTQLYIGLGPRLDCFWSQGEVYTELLGGDNHAYDLRSYKVGITGNIGVNFQLEKVNFGIKTNYYYRPIMLEKEFNMDPNNHGQTNDYKYLSIRNHLFDLQFAIGYQLGKRKN